MKQSYDAVIIGGGIVGAGIFREMALHGQNCLLVDKKDFSSQTSSKSSKMLHGGIRYLAQWDFDLVKEALHEKNLWLKLAPHLSYEMPFHMPVFNDSKYPLWMLGSGLFLYDLLSSFENSPFKVLGKNKTINKIEGIQTDGLKGTGIYYDAVMDDTKLGLESIYDGINHGGIAKNYTEVIKVEKFNGEWKVFLKDCLNNEESQVLCKQLIMATGPFTDQVMKTIYNENWSPKILPSKGIHLWLKPDTLNIKDPVVLMTDDERVIFIIPQKNSILVGTTEDDAGSDFFDVEAKEEEVQYLLDQVKLYFPKFKNSKETIIDSFAGIRPLVKEGNTEDKGKTSRDHKIFMPAENFYVIAGGKYTTFRKMANDLCQVAFNKRNITHNPDKTKVPFSQKSLVFPFENTSITHDKIRQIIAHELPRTLGDLLFRRLGLFGKEHWPYDSDIKTFFAPILAEIQEALYCEPELLELISEKKTIKNATDRQVRFEGQL